MGRNQDAASHFLLFAAICANFIEVDSSSVATKLTHTGSSFGGHREIDTRRGKLMLRDMFSVSALSRQVSICCVSSSARETETQSKLSQGENTLFIPGTSLMVVE